MTWDADDLSNQLRLWLPCTVAIWLLVFVVVVAQGGDYTGDGQFTVSDASAVAYDISAGWFERASVRGPCEARNGLERFFETNRCEWGVTFKWFALVLYFAAGSGLAWLLLLVGKIARRLLT